MSRMNHIALENSNIALKQFNAAAWVLKTSTGTEDNGADMIGVHKNVQKKLVPWCSTFPGQDLGSELRQKREEGLIVVASLIDRLPNLGGLSRTCEVFGVSEYVVGNLKYTEDKQFRSLSVTAEQWVPISEVKPQFLSMYLEAKKKDGYTLIGAEQTSNSTRLNDFKFTQKTLLLLGNEKEGIPADLLPFLDVCVEIPQEGVVRSLNVHVTGALFVWEYMRQQALAGTHSNRVHSQEEET
ncbi:hypothetical protein B7P43_G08580 [Cryptotermes secundus]|nr:hypothetical protein B7P43_G08580 [Cryptotermes secundus]